MNEVKSTRTAAFAALAIVGALMLLSSVVDARDVLSRSVEVVRTHDVGTVAKRVELVTRSGYGDCDSARHKTRTRTMAASCDGSQTSVKTRTKVKH